MKESSIILPVSIVSPTDIARLTREIEHIDGFFRDAAIRQPGVSNALPRLSRLMDQLVSDNKLNLLQTPDRNKISTVLDSLHDSAPIMHISFSVDPPGAYVQKIVAWLRDNIHPQVLVTVGLQPNIGAGCIVRTNSKMFDFSLREYFAQKRDFFIAKLHDSISDDGVQENTAETSEEAEVVQAVEPTVAEPSTANDTAAASAPDSPRPAPLSDKAETGEAA